MSKPITLQEGLDDFNRKNEKYFSKRSYSPEGEEFMKCHDIAHVIFGCDTTLSGEGTVKIWSTFGTTASFLQITKGYKEANAIHLFKAYSVSHFLKQIGTLLFRIPSIILRAKRMSKPWPFNDYDQYLNTPISKIRKEFDIDVF